MGDVTIEQRIANLKVGDKIRYLGHGVDTSSTYWKEGDILIINSLRPTSFPTVKRESDGKKVVYY